MHTVESPSQQDSMVEAHLNSALSSGAPPVMSTVRTDVAVAMSSTHRRAVARSIISVRSGELSTWQWLHACCKHGHIDRRM